MVSKRKHQREEAGNEVPVHTGAMLKDITAGLDLMILKSPVQPEIFCDSVIYCPVNSVRCLWS